MNKNTWIFIEMIYTKLRIVDYLWEISGEKENKIWEFSYIFLTEVIVAKDNL